MNINTKNKFVKFGTIIAATTMSLYLLFCLLIESPDWVKSIEAIAVMSICMVVLGIRENNLTD